jgi:hypothetical protein
MSSCIVNLSRENVRRKRTTRMRKKMMKRRSMVAEDCHEVFT